MAQPVTPVVWVRDRSRTSESSRAIGSDHAIPDVAPGLVLHVIKDRCDQTDRLG
jgi:hypothetical protein